MTKSRDQLAEEVKRAQQIIPEIIREIVDVGNNYHNEMSKFIRRIDNFRKNSACRNLVENNPDIYNENFFKQLDAFMAPYKSIAKSEPVSMEQPLDEVLHRLGSETNLQSMVDATTQIESFNAFKDRYKTFFAAAFPKNQVQLYDYTPLPMQKTIQYAMQLQRLNENLIKIDPESIDGHRVRQFHRLVSEKVQYANEKIRQLDVMREDELERIVNARNKQQLREFNVLKNDALMQLENFIQTRHHQFIKMGGNLKMRARNVITNIELIEVDGSNASTKRGLDELSRALSDIKIPADEEEHGMLYSMFLFFRMSVNPLKTLCENLNKKVHDSEIYVELDKMDTIGKNSI